MNDFFISPSLSAWDTLPQRSMLQGAQEHDAERKAHCEWLEHEIFRVITGGNAGAILRCVKARRTGSPSLADALFEGIDAGDLKQELVQLLIGIAAGHTGEATAGDLLRRAVAAFADGEVR